MNKLAAKKLSKWFGKRKVVDEVTLEVNKGEIVGLLGPNGAGKTTIFKMMVGLIHPVSGSILLEAEEITKLPMYLRAKKGIVYLPQESSIFRKLTVWENLYAIAEFSDMTKEAKKRRVEELLNEFDLTALANSVAVSLSGGEKRRCEIARSMLTDPNFLLLDEPFVGIDPITVAEIQRMIGELKQKGIGILVTDHNVHEMLEVIDRAYIIYEGKILLEGDAKALLNSQEARRLYLGEKFQVK
ncbi:MAG: LPS export ABC transporter ATP-binding protein [Elusimicrobiota bacterium]